MASRPFDDGPNRGGGHDAIREDTEPDDTPSDPSWLKERIRLPQPDDIPDSDERATATVANAAGEVIDEADQVAAREGPVVSAELKPLTHHQQMQRRVSTASLTFVGFVIAAGVVRWLIDPTIDLASYTANLLAPVIGLVATIVGYFFGIASTERQDRRRRKRKK